MQGINVFWEGDSALHPTYSKHMGIRSLGMEQSSVKQTPPELLPHADRNGVPLP